MFRFFLLVTFAASIYQDQIGTYDWHKLHIGKVIDIHATTGGKSIAISNRGILAMIKPSGELEWRRILSSIDAYPLFTMSASGIFTYSSGTLTMWTIQEGQILWSRPMPEVLQLVLTTQGISEVLAVLTENTIEIISLQEGELMKKIDLGKPERIVFKNKDSIFVMDKEKNVWKINSKNWITEKIEFGGFGEVICAKDSCVAINGKRAKVINDGEVKEINWDVGRVQSVLDKFYVCENENLVEIAGDEGKSIKQIGKHMPSENSQMWLVESSSDLTIYSLEGSSITLPSSSIPVLKFWGYINSKGEFFGYILYEDYSILCFRNTSIRWIREEGLGHTSSLYFLELPSKEMHAHNQYFAYIKDHNTWSDVLTNFLLRIESQINHRSIELEALEKDSFAFKKLIIAVSKSEYIFAIQSLNSQIFWRLKVKNLIKVVQLSHEEAILIENDGKKTKLTYLDIIEGKKIKEQSYDIETVDVLQIGNEEDSAVYLVDKDFKLLPVVKHSGPELFFYVIDSKNGLIEGLKHNNGINSKVWAMKLGSGEKILTYITNKAGKIHQPAIATGTSRLIYKYADENLFAVASQKGQELFVYVINAISGHIIYRLHQDQVSGSIHLAFHEQKLYIHYWNIKYERYEIISAEFFKSNVDDSASDVLQGYYSGGFSTDYSSKFTPEVTVFTQTYVFPYGVKDMKFTTTLQGITKPSLVMILESNQIYLLDSAFLSPRRKLEDNHDEGLFDDPTLPIYKPNIPWSSVNIANYFIELEGITKLATTETWLESTSVVIAYDLDMFLIRVMPEKSFDVLSEDFSKSAIVLTIGGLALLNILVQRWFSSKCAKENFNT
ncbi:hypothetical protein SteCoe_10915 [Stentor coeruleus]|uniref:ER membrane protein complex subunit 1 n=1 Tax=Stentor coeruleus TaxID=5963 RepID=A0A1R2CEF1_9CILI|nr:hypothetical protein SteCoe_10915 [Stentor coeruleus]